MKTVKLYTLILCLLIAACGTSVTNQDEEQIQTTSDNSQMIKIAQLKLVNRSNKKEVTLQDASVTNSLQNAFSDKQRTYEKLLPLFEYEIKFEKDGQEEVWRLNKAGYLMKEGTSELYKMDTSMLHTHMK